MANEPLRIPPEVIAEVRKLRAAGHKVRDISKQFGITADQIYIATLDMPTDPRTIKHRIAKLIRDQPELTDEEVAARIGHDCKPSLVADRRIEYEKNQKSGKVLNGMSQSDKTDTGARVDAKWLRQHCSRGQRDLYQIQAIWTSKYTIADILISCVLAGLPVHKTTKLVGTKPERDRSYDDGSSTRVIKTSRATGRRGKVI